jgi:hypothetical protein
MAWTDDRLSDDKNLSQNSMGKCKYRLSTSFACVPYPAASSCGHAHVLVCQFLT